MRLKYRLNFGDYLLFQAAHQLCSVPLQAMYLLIAWSFFQLSTEQIGTLGGVIGASIAYLFMWLLQLSFNVIYLYSRNNASLLTEHVVEVQDDAFYEETRFNRSSHYWPGIVRIVKRPGFLAVYLSAQLAHVIPSRAFSDDEQRNKFYAMVKERIRASKLTTPAQ
jgi:hypothetical protein